MEEYDWQKYKDLKEVIKFRVEEIKNRMEEAQFNRQIIKSRLEYYKKKLESIEECLKKERAI